MSYIGSSAAPLPVNFRGVQTQALSPNGSTSLFTLNRAVTSVTDIEVVVNNVQQSPFDGSYSIVNSGLGLQFSENPTAGTNSIYITYRDQPMGSIIDPTAVRKTGDTMTGALTVGGNILVGSLPGGVRTIGASSGSDTTVVIQAGAAVGGGPNLELTRDQIAYLDSNQTIFRSTDGSTQYGKFDTAGRLTVPNQPMLSCLSAGTNGTTLAGMYAFGQASPDLNVGSYFNTTTRVFTCPVAGNYRVSVSASNGDGSYHYLNAVKNGASVGSSPSLFYVTYTSAAQSVIIPCAAGDTIGAANRYNSGLYSVQFSIELIS